MSSAGSVSLQLVLDRNKFDQDLTKLQQEKVGAVAVKLKIDTKDFERQIKGLSGFIPPVDVPVHLNIQPQAVKKQFEQIGEYAALGFAQGFSGAEDAGKAAVDAMVTSTRKQLGIQSPSKVFRQIGKYAAQGLLEGLRVEASDVRAITKSLEDEFKKSNISLGKVDLGKVKASIDLDANSISGDIASAVEQGIKSASKQSIFSSLTGGLLKAIGGIGSGLLSAFLLPVKAVAGVAMLAFTGAGLKLGEDLGAGVSGGLKNAIKSALGDSVGSGEVVGEAIGETLVKGIAESIEGSFPGILKSMADQARQSLGEAKVFTAGAVGRSQAQVRQQKIKEAAGTQLQQELSAKIEGGIPQRAKQLKTQIDQVSPQLKIDSEALEAEILAEQKRLQELASENIEISYTPETLGKERALRHEEKIKSYEKMAADFDAAGENGKADRIRMIAGQLKPLETDPTKISAADAQFASNADTANMRSLFVSQGIQKQFGARRADIAARKSAISPLMEEYESLAKELERISLAIEAVGVESTIKPTKQVEKSKSPKLYQEIAQEVFKLSGVEFDPESIPNLDTSYKLPKGSGAQYVDATNTIRVTQEVFDAMESGVESLSEELLEALSTLVPHEIRHGLQFGLGSNDVYVSGETSIPLLSPTPKEARELGRNIEFSVAQNTPEEQPVSRKLETDAYVFASRNSAAIKERLKARIPEIQREKAAENFQGEFGVGGAKIAGRLKAEAVKASKRLAAINALAKEAGQNITKELQPLMNNVMGLANGLDPLLDQASNLEILSAQSIQELQLNLQNALDAALDSLNLEIESAKAIAMQRIHGVPPTTIANSSSEEAPPPPPVTQASPPPPPPPAALPEQTLSAVLEKIPPLKLPPSTKADLGLNSAADVEKFLKQNLNAKGVKDLARRLGIDTKNANKEYLSQEIRAFGGSAAGRETIAQRIQLSPDKMLSGANVAAEQMTDASELIEQLKESRKMLADALKSIEDTEGEDKETALKALLEKTNEQQSAAEKLSTEYQLPSDQGKSLGGVRSQLKGIADQAKIALSNGKEIGSALSQGVGVGLASSGKAVVKQSQHLMSSVETAAKKQAGIRSPSTVFAVIGKFLGDGLALGIASATSAKKAVASAMDDLSITAKAKATKLASEFKNGKEGSSAYGDFYSRLINKPINEMEQNASRLEENAKKSAKQTAKSVEAGRKLVADASARKKVRAELDAKLKLLEAKNKTDPSVGADLALDDINREKARRDRTIGEILGNPLRFLRQRSKNAVVQKARYMTENASGIADLVGAKIGDSPDPKQTAALLRLQAAFGDLGDAALKFGQNESKKNFEQLDNAVKELEASLRKAGVPFELINQQIAAYTDNLKEMQGEGKIDVDVDVESLAPEKFSIIDNLMAKFSGLELKGVKALAGLVKGFFALTALSFVQRIFTDIGQGAFRAFVELDRLKTTLNFASGGPGGGARNLEFVRKTVDDLRVPLQASTEGFTQMAAAARGSAIEGEQTRQLFLGVSQASSVLSLSADSTKGAILALSQMMSKGKVQSEEMRLQLGERIPGALGIAARAMGLTQEEFTRLMESGQLISENFLPKFAKQLQAEFGEASKGASQNAESAVFALENATLSLQQGLGEAVAPAAVAGLNALSATMNGLAKIATELGFILLAITTTLGVKMAIALKAVIANLIATKMVTGTLSGGFANLAQTINNSFSAKLTLGIFAVLEVIKLLNDAVNTELVKSFEEAAKSAERAAERSRKAFEAAKGNKSSTTEPESSSGVGRFLDKYVIGALNFGNDKFRVGNLLTPGGMGLGDKLQTYGGLEQQRITQAIAQSMTSGTDLIASTRLRLAELKTGEGGIGKLRAVDSDLLEAEQRRQILKADTERDYTQKGIAIPAEVKAQMGALDLQIKKLNDLRSEVSTPFTLDLSDIEKRINSVGSELENLQQSEVILAVGGEEEAAKLTKQLKEFRDNLRQTKYEAETALASLRVDPVLAFTQALRSLNLRLSESQERNERKSNDVQAMIAAEKVAGFSSNPMAARSAAVQGAMKERDIDRSSALELEQIVQETDSAINAPELQSTLRRLGVSPQSTISQVSDMIKYTQDEADKGVLEQFKAALEQRGKLSVARVRASESEDKFRGVVQDNSLFDIEESAAKSRAATQKGENSKIAKVRDAEALRLIEPQEAAEKISRIQLQSTQSQMKNLDMQLAMLRAYYEQGAISAEEFARRERDLTIEQTNLDRTEAENRLAVVAAMKDRRLKLIETMNKEAEAAIALSQTTATTGVKMGILGADLDGQQAAQAQNFIDQEAAKDKIHLLKQQIDQTKELRSQGLLTATEATEKELALNQELAQANQQLIDQQIQAQEQLRAAIEKTFERRKSQLNLENGQRDTQIQAQSLDALKAVVEISPQIDLQFLDRETNRKSLENKQAFLDNQLEIVNEQLAGIEKLNLAEQDAADKKRELLLEIDRLTREKITTERDLILNKTERIKKAEEDRYKQSVSYLDQQKAALDLYNQSLDRTIKLEESRFNLSKAIADANISGLERQRDEANLALELFRKSKDRSLRPRVRREARSQLRELSMGTREIDILDKRSKIEEEIAAKKLQALQKEQQYQQRALELDLQRQKIAAQTAVYDAQSAQLAAAKAKLEADSALKLAQIKGDPEAIAIAEIGVELAQREGLLADKKLENALATLGIQSELEKNAKEGQKITQANAIQQEQAGNRQRRSATELEKVGAGKRTGGRWNYDLPMQKQSSAPLSDRLIPLNQRPGENMFEAFERQQAELNFKKAEMPFSDRIASKLKETELNPSAFGQVDLVEALTKGNSGVEKQLAILNERIMQLANSPRSLTVQTPNPVDDAASIMNDLARKQVAGAGI